jgi:hypothetical protein
VFKHLHMFQLLQLVFLVSDLLRPLSINLVLAQFIVYLLLFLAFVLLNLAQ